MGAQKLLPFTLYARKPSKQVAQILANVCQYLQDQKIDYAVEDESAKLHSLSGIPTRPLAQVTTGLLVSIGGDGSLLQLVAHALAHNLAITGINAGKVGFLTDINRENLSELAAILDGHYIQEPRALLQAQWQHEGKQTKSIPGLNEIALLKHNPSKMMHYALSLHHKVIANHHADGIIIATPTGSTAYSLSAGGPILDPALSAHLILPVCAHSLSSRPIVLPAESQIQLDVLGPEKTECMLCVDGHSQGLLSPGSSVIINTLPQSLQLIHPSNYDFFATLQHKLHWEKPNHAKTS